MIYDLITGTKTKFKKALRKASDGSWTLKGHLTTVVLNDGEVLYSQVISQQDPKASEVDPLLNLGVTTEESKRLNVLEEAGVISSRGRREVLLALRACCDTDYFEED